LLARVQFGNLIDVRTDLKLPANYLSSEKYGRGGENIVQMKKYRTSNLNLSVF